MRAKQWRNGILIGLLFIAAFWLATSIWSLADKALVAVSQAGETRTQYQSLEARKAILEANLEALGTERGKDAAIRTAFGVARPGEEVIVVVPPATAAPVLEPPWWQKILNWF
ncbi:hypothetical protein KGM48_02790 [Patescibacteria group bacterium]|nr:hypothetical protein [Patescibacteria group bacterium]